MSLKHLIVTTPFILVLTQGCSNNSSIFSKDHLPLVHKVDVQQGNVITQEMLAKLQTGMTKKKVRFIMGTPLISDTFHNDRWDYVYTYKDGREIREQRRVTLFFKDDLLSTVGGDIVAARGEIKLKSRKVESVDVPPAKPAGVFAQVKEKLSFDKDKPKAERKKAVEQPQMVGEGEQKEGFLGRLFDGDDDGVETYDEVVTSDDEENEFGPNDPYLHETESDEQIDYDSIEQTKTIRAEDRVDPELDPNNPYLNEQDQQIEFPEEEEKEERAARSDDDDEEFENDEPGFFGKLWDKVSSDDNDDGEEEDDVELDIDPDSDPNDPYLYEK